MGGGVRSRNPTGCCPENATTSCIPQQCGDHGNLFTGYSTNPNAEFNIFGDPFAAYQVLGLDLQANAYLHNCQKWIFSPFSHLYIKTPFFLNLMSPFPKERKKLHLICLLPPVFN